MGLCSALRSSYPTPTHSHPHSRPLNGWLCLCGLPLTHSLTHSLTACPAWPTLTHSHSHSHSLTVTHSHSLSSSSSSSLSSFASPSSLFVVRCSSFVVCRRRRRCRRRRCRRPFIRSMVCLLQPPLFHPSVRSPAASASAGFGFGWFGVGRFPLLLAWMFVLLGCDFNADVLGQNVVTQIDRCGCRVEAKEFVGDDACSPCNTQVGQWVCKWRARSRTGRMVGGSTVKARFGTVLLRRLAPMSRPQCTRWHGGLCTPHPLCMPWASVPCSRSVASFSSPCLLPVFRQPQLFFFSPTFVPLS